MPVLRGLGLAPELLLSRHVSWLQFVGNVQALAGDIDRPLHERLRYLWLAAENLDGFYMKRVDALRSEAELGVSTQPPWPPATARQLAQVHHLGQELTSAAERLWRLRLRSPLARAGLAVVDWSQLADDDRDWCTQHFLERVLPILTPLAVDPGRPFPYLSHLSLSLAVNLADDQGGRYFARVKVPAQQHRWVSLPDNRRVLPLEELIAAHLEHLFRGMRIVGSYPFRVTRTVDTGGDEERTSDLRDFAQELLRGRRFAPIVRVEVDKRMPVETRALLADELKVPADGFVECTGPLALVDLAHLPQLERLPGGRPSKGRAHPLLPVDDGPDALFGALREHDVIVHHPLHDYRRTVAAFVKAAAADPQVRAIKQSLYRTSERSDTLEALIAAAQAGKEVLVLLELQARLDEAANIAWAQRLVDAGVHVSFGFVGYKTHTRVTLVVREEGDTLRRYVHFGTGDYNVASAAEYTDVSLLSAQPALSEDVTRLFNFMTGVSHVDDLTRLSLAPQTMRETLIELIDAETAAQERGEPARVTVMVNALADLALFAALCRASCAGVPIDLIVRRECGLQPGVKGYSEQIRVRRVVGNWLEHRRVFRFGSGARERIYISSADWLARNLDHRIEAMCPVEDSSGRRELSALLDLYLADTAAAWELRARGEWRRVRPKPGAEPLSAQASLGRKLAAVRRRRPRSGAR